MYQYKVTKRGLMDGIPECTKNESEGRKEKKI